MKTRKLPQPIRGELWLIKLDPTVGHEQAKTLPCLIISVDLYNSSHSKMVTMVPLTSSKRKLSWHVEIGPTKTNGLKKTSYIITDQIRTLSKKRIVGGPLGYIDNNVLQQVEKRIRILLQLPTSTTSILLSN